MATRERRRGDIYVLDDENLVSRFALKCELHAAEYNASFFVDKEVLYNAIKTRVPLCVCLCQIPLIDLGPILNDIAKYRVPVIVVSRQGDIPTAVKVIKAGAVDFISGQADYQKIVHRIEQALEEVQEKIRKVPWRQHFPGRRALSPRERDVLEQIANRTSRQIASVLGISQRTVEDHRERIKEKLEVRNMVELMIAIMHEGPH